MDTASSQRLRLPDAPAPERRRLECGGVAVWEEPLTIDTYEPLAPERLPVFFDRRVYQGSSGRVYPLPFVERISTEARPREWAAVHLENAWVRLVLLPELGGRIHVGYDKTADYDFFYRNNVIKPALVGLAGPWVSGGVEFNWPQHHRPGTFLPMETFIEHEDDGAVTVWMSDHDPFARMKGMHGIRLRPDSTVIELRARLHNRTEETQTFLWWANVAARAHEQYQSFFPTDVRYVADHARRAITAFPRADRPYYGVDYPARATPQHPDADRIDIYSNIPVPTSYMVVETRDDFFGGYDHRARAGFVHWADRRIAPGKKQWTWGDSAFGHAWDDHLTDEDGPYVELMAGVYTDNQPDFSYLAPGETKTFSQYWFPITEIGPAHQATRDAAVSVELTGGDVVVGVAVTRVMTDAVVRVRILDEVWDHTVPLAPGAPLHERIALPPDARAEDITVSVLEAGRTVIEWTPRSVEDGAAEPAVATEPPMPDDIASSDELYLTGVHLAQYRHPTRTPEPYWEEMRRRDPGDSRANIALGASAYRRGEYDRARELLRTAVGRLTHRNPNPADGEVFYRLGLVETRRGDAAAAYDAFAKAAWDVRWAHPANLRMAMQDAAAGRLVDALGCAAVAARYDAEDLTLHALRVVVLRRLERNDEADAVMRAARALDPLDTLLRVLDGAETSADARTLLDAAGDLHAMGEDEAALDVLARAAALPATMAGGSAPLAHHLAALILERSGRVADAHAARRRAASAPDDYAFPAGLDLHDALSASLNADPADWRAAHLLGMWLFDAGRRVEAQAVWTRAIEAGGDSPVLLRNAALAAVETLGDDEGAAALYERALSRGDDPRLWYEMDQLAVRRGVPAAERLNRLAPALGRHIARDDLLVVAADLHTELGRGAEARALLTSRRLQPWEGGEGQAVRAHARACAADALTLGPDQAIAILESALAPPASLGETWHPLESRAPWWRALGDAHAANGDEEAARTSWRRAIAEALAAASAAPVEQTVVDAIRAADRLGDVAARDRLRQLVRARLEVLRTTRPRIDYFATSLPETLLFSATPEQQAAREEQQWDAVLEETADPEETIA